MNVAFVPEISTMPPLPTAGDQARPGDSRAIASSLGSACWSLPGWLSAANHCNQHSAIVLGAGQADAVGRQSEQAVENGTLGGHPGVQ